MGASEHLKGSDRPGESPNDHVVRHLKQYLAFPHPPGSALLLNGAWGSGKTFLVRELVREQGRLSRTVLLVSLYGLKERREIVDALLLARYPALADLNGAEGDGEYGIRGRTLVTTPAADAYVFDDLERCSMPLADVMGFLNLLVERDGRKVVVLANEQPITGGRRGREYRAAKEKVVGRSLTVRPDFERAFDSFLGRIDVVPAADLLRGMRAEIRRLFEQSGVDNLRILQQTMWDLERVLVELRPEHHEGTDAMRALLRLLMALSFEHRAGRLDPDDLEDRFSKIHSGMFGESAPPNTLRTAARRYTGVALYDSILPDHVLHAILVDGLVDGEALRAALDESSWFLRDEEPTWRTLWHSHERSDDETLMAAGRLQQEFSDRAYTGSGEILHVFGQMLKLSDYGAIGWSTEETLRQCRQYVDDLRSSGSLEAPDGPAQDETRFGSYAGLGFDRRGKPAFDELWAYLGEQRRLAEEDRHSRLAQDLLVRLRDEPAEFAAMIGPRGGTAGIYADKPVLARTDPLEVADVLAGLPPLTLNEVLQALSGRYELGAFRRSLGSELPWARRLRDALLERAERLGIFGRERMTQMVGWTIAARLAEVEAEPAEQRPVADG